MKLPVKGAVTIIARQIAAGGDNRVELQFAVRFTTIRGNLAEEEPFFRLYREQPNGVRALLYKSEVLDSIYNPERIWEACPALSMSELTGGVAPDEARVVLECWGDGIAYYPDVAMGRVDISVQGLLAAGAEGKPMPLVAAEKDEEVIFGEIDFHSFNVVVEGATSEVDAEKKK